MGNQIKKIGILTGGGDCPGLNSVLYGIMLKAYDVGVECVGILKGWKGFVENLTIPLDIAEHDDLHTVGGTILYTSRTNPFKGDDSKKKRARELINNNTIYKKYLDKHYIYNILMEKYDKIRVNGMVVETLHPNNPILKN